MPIIKKRLWYSYSQKSVDKGIVFLNTLFLEGSMQEVSGLFSRTKGFIQGSNQELDTWVVLQGSDGWVNCCTPSTMVGHEKNVDVRFRSWSFDRMG